MKKKIGQFVAALPFWVCLLTLLYGMLHIDFADGESNVPYGWYFTLFGLVPVIILYIVGLVSNVGFAIYHFFHSKGKIQKYFSLLYLVAVIWAIVYLLPHPYILGFYVVLQEPMYICFFIVLYCLPLLKRLVSEEVETVALWPRFSSRIFQKQQLLKVFSVFILVLSGVPILYEGLQTYSLQRSLEKEVRNLHHKHKADYAIQLPSLAFYKILGTTVRGTVTDHGVTLPIEVNFDAVSSGWKAKLKAVSFLNESSSLGTLLTQKAVEKEAKAVINDYQKAVESAIAKKGWSDLKIDVDDYGKPTFEMPNSYTLTSELLEEARKNRRSTKETDQAFDGFYAISLDTYMHQGYMIPSVSLEDYSNQYPVEELLPLVDFSQLPDGFYAVNYILVAVVSGKIVALTDQWYGGNLLYEEEYHYPALGESHPDLQEDPGQVIKQYLEGQGKSYGVEVIMHVGGNNRCFVYLSQGRLKVPALVTFDNQQVSSISFAGDDSWYNQSLLARSYANSQEAQTHRKRFADLVTEAITKTSHKDKLSVLPVESQPVSTWTGYRWFELSDDLMAKKAAYANSSDPNQSAFSGFGGLTFQDLVAEGALVSDIGLTTSDDTTYDWDTYKTAKQDILDHLDTSQLPDGLYIIDYLAFQIKDGEIVNQTESSPFDSSLVSLSSPAYFSLLTQEEWDDYNSLDDEVFHQDEE